MAFYDHSVYVRTLAFLRSLQRTTDRRSFLAREHDDERHVRQPMIELLA